MHYGNCGDEKMSELRIGILKVLVHYGNGVDQLIEEIRNIYNPIFINKGQYCYIIQPRCVEDIDNITNFLLSRGITRYRLGN